jgi:hypothetical protein
MFGGCPHHVWNLSRPQAELRHNSSGLLHFTDGLSRFVF